MLTRLDNDFRLHHATYVSEVMIQALLSLPTPLGYLAFAAITTVVGLTVYYVTFRLHSKYQTPEAMQEVGEATNAAHETLRSRAVADVDKISDYRKSRLKQAREQPSSVLIVVFLGYLVTMVYLAVYPPRRVVVVLISFYTAFVRVVFYLILAISDPFESATPIDSAPLEYVVGTMESAAGSEQGR